MCYLFGYHSLAGPNENNLLSLSGMCTFKGDYTMSSVQFKNQTDYKAIERKKV